ncbi:hypothetical protein B0H14DRAFT_3133324 [Mycena olivaceomarginata]|nr:hypothetical protein B0H14DRAFT_3133324 [Mycena olivaceomarginata]
MTQIIPKPQVKHMQYLGEMRVWDGSRRRRRRVACGGQFDRPLYSRTSISLPRRPSHAQGPCAGQDTVAASGRSCRSRLCSPKIRKRWKADVPAPTYGQPRVGKDNGAVDADERLPSPPPHLFLAPPPPPPHFVSPLTPPPPPGVIAGCISNVWGQVSVKRLPGTFPQHYEYNPTRLFQDPYLSNVCNGAAADGAGEKVAKRDWIGWVRRGEGWEKEPGHGRQREQCEMQLESE